MNITDFLYQFTIIELKVAKCHKPAEGIGKQYVTVPDKIRHGSRQIVAAILIWTSWLCMRLHLESTTYRIEWLARHQTVLKRG